MALQELSTKRSTSYNSTTNTDYVYLTTVYWDDEESRKVTKRKVIGKIDPATGEMVETGARGRPRKERPEPGVVDYKRCYEELLQEVKKEGTPIQVPREEMLQMLDSIQTQVDALRQRIMSL